jgi:cobalamin-dependent methionine synthase I
MDMGIVNAGQLVVYDEIEPRLRELCEDVILNRNKGCDSCEGPAAPSRSHQCGGGCCGGH